MGLDQLLEAICRTRAAALGVHKVVLQTSKLRKTKPITNLVGYKIGPQDW